MKATMYKLICVLALLLPSSLLAQTTVDIRKINGNTIATGNGVTGSDVQRVTISSDNTAFSVNATLSAETTKVIGTVNVASAQSIRILGNTGAAMDAAGQNASSPANELLIAGQFNTSPTTITSGNISPLQLSSGGSLLVQCTSGCTAGTTISLVANATGGATVAHLLLAASNNATSLKASAGKLYTACVNNTTTYPLWLKFYNKATAPAPASDTPVFEVFAQASLRSCFDSAIGAGFATGIAYAVVKNPSDTDNTSVAASDGTVELAYN